MRPGSKVCPNGRLAVPGELRSRRSDRTRYAPATAAADVWSYAGIVNNLGLYYTSVKEYGETYRVFHSITVPFFSVEVYPAKPGQCVEVQLQEYSGSTWHRVTTQSCAKLSSTGSGYSYLMDRLSITGGTGHLFRIDAAYYRPPSDHTSLNSTGAWQYFTITR